MGVSYCNKMHHNKAFIRDEELGYLQLKVHRDYLLEPLLSFSLHCPWLFWGRRSLTYCHGYLTDIPSATATLCFLHQPIFIIQNLHSTSFSGS